MKKPTKPMSSNSKNPSRSSPKIRPKLNRTATILRPGHSHLPGLHQLTAVQTLHKPTDPSVRRTGLPGLRPQTSIIQAPSNLTKNKLKTDLHLYLSSPPPWDFIPGTLDHPHRSQTMKIMHLFALWGPCCLFAIRSLSLNELCSHDAKSRSTRFRLWVVVESSPFKTAMW